MQYKIFWMCTLNCSHFKENNPWQFKWTDYRKVGEMYLGFDKDKEKRLATTGKWFEPGLKTKTNIWSAIILPIILIISLLFTVFITLS